MAKNTVRLRCNLMGFIWLCAGVGVWQRSWVFLMDPYVTRTLMIMLLVVALVISWVKAKYVLDIAAHKFVIRTASAPHEHPIRLINIRWILLVLIMSGMGVALRSLPYDASVKTMALAILYPGIGTALIWSSLILLGHRNHRHSRFKRPSKETRLGT